VVHQDLRYCKFVYVHRDDHGVILGWINCGEVVISKGNWRYVWTFMCRSWMDGLNRPQMFLPCRVGVSTTYEVACDIINSLSWYAEQNWANNSVNNFTNSLFGSTSSLKALTLGTGLSDRTFASFLPGRTLIIITASSVSSFRAFFVSRVVNVTLGWPWCGGRLSNKFAKVTVLDEFFYFIF